MKRKNDFTALDLEIRDILKAASRNTQDRSEPEADPEELDGECNMDTMFGYVANGCGRHDPAAKENGDFISPVLLAA